jgi:type I restriction enzyme, S subunit
VSNWWETSLAEVLQIHHGFAFSGDGFMDQGEHLVLTPGNFCLSGGLQVRPGKERYFDQDFDPKWLLGPGDLVIAMTDLKQSAPILGSTARIPEQGKFLHNQRIGLVELIADKLDERFAYYLLNSELVRSQLRASATGSTVRHTAPARIESCQIKIPPIETQRVIGGILRTFDDLIENNQQRVGFLEETARLLYREWFVNFRYPGHEEVPLVESESRPFPKGWRVAELGEILTLAYGKALKAADRVGGPVAVYGSGGLVGWHDEPLVSGPAIIVGRAGTAGSVHWSETDAHPIDSAFYVSSSLPSRWLHQMLITCTFVLSGAAIPILNRHDLYRTQILMPNTDLIENFDRLIAPVYGLSASLSCQTAFLKEARDLLLPRLVSGDLDISDLNLGLEAVS